MLSDKEPRRGNSDARPQSPVDPTIEEVHVHPSGAKISHGIEIPRRLLRCLPSALLTSIILAGSSWGAASPPAPTLPPPAQAPTIASLSIASLSQQPSVQIDGTGRRSGEISEAVEQALPDKSLEERANDSKLSAVFGETVGADYTTKYINFVFGGVILNQYEIALTGSGPDGDEPPFTSAALEGGDTDAQVFLEGDFRYRWAWLFRSSPVAAMPKSIATLQRELREKTRERDDVASKLANGAIATAELASLRSDVEQLNAQIEAQTLGAADLEAQARALARLEALQPRVRTLMREMPPLRDAWDSMVGRECGSDDDFAAERAAVAAAAKNLRSIASKVGLEISEYDRDSIDRAAKSRTCAEFMLASGTFERIWEQFRALDQQLTNEKQRQEQAFDQATTAFNVRSDLVRELTTKYRRDQLAIREWSRNNARLSVVGPRTWKRGVISWFVPDNWGIRIGYAFGDDTSASAQAIVGASDFYGRVGLGWDLARWSLATANATDTPIRGSIALEGSTLWFTNRTSNDIHQRGIFGMSASFGIPIQFGADDDKAASIVEVVTRIGAVYTEIPQFVGTDDNQLELEYGFPAYDYEWGAGFDIEMNVPVTRSLGYLMLRGSLDGALDPNRWSVAIGYTIPLEAILRGLTGNSP